ncbi:uncharacterized protein NECHADRAFT_88923 [Fusarium vanettenii 77-13-4]|uniref:Cytochrome P450 n=1 Tax=Fusarium vanettenii (strain ATCC MYA-4622 / CBS 123669 / FGSC 9596 / NRRL 45880 / 77-13-4) TaxID=660122 RepID=C7ZGT1_FUSV7|nr:uncharacterized protein NECHADRAFT_88923 [Fusarium vanettenii 77-13-4]EEU36767.1 hypothetical protein NECHADRAFT_88923 [Fusarium vanettenii 77-13-4]
MHPYLLLLAPALLLAVQLLIRLYQILASPLASVPGPWLARFTDLWYAWRINRGQFERDNIALHQKHGPIVRYGPKRYSICDPLAAKVIYGHGGAFLKSSCMSSLVNYEHYVDECTRLFLQRLSEMSGRQGTAEPVDMGHWFQCYAFDVIGMITYSKRLGFLDHGQDVGDIIKNLENHLYYATEIGVYPSLHQYLAPIRNRLGKRGTGRHYIVEFTKQCLADHQSNPKAIISDDLDSASEYHGTMDFLSKFIAKNTADNSSFTQYHVLAGCVANMVAGSDTTAISLSAILYHLLRNPDKLRILREEIEGFFSNKTGPATSINFQDSLGLPYLQAVIKEALRMHPATGLPIERVVPKGGAAISGKFFPEGVRGHLCSANGITLITETDHPIFGQDANSFRPERWLTTDADQLSKMSRHWMPFGLGSRTCIGRHISTLEISKMIPRLLHEFDFELRGDKP